MDKLVRIFNIDSAERFLMAKKLISELTVKEAAKKGQKSIAVTPDTIVTTAARDAARSLKIDIVPSTEIKPEIKKQNSSEQSKKVAYHGTLVIGSDHGGYQLKEQLKPFIETLGFTVMDIGTTTEEACDYPDYAFAVAKLVSSGDASRGIMIDSVGVASAMVANKIPGIRAAACQCEFAAQSSREHNDANVLTIGGKITGLELAKSIVRIWLTTEFTAGRHQKRVDKISEIDIKLRKA